jgi:hypothetical protein
MSKGSAVLLSGMASRRFSASCSNLSLYDRGGRARDESLDQSYRHYSLRAHLFSRSAWESGSSRGSLERRRHMPLASTAHRRGWTVFDHKSSASSGSANEGHQGVQPAAGEGYRASNRAGVFSPPARIAHIIRSVHVGDSACATPLAASLSRTTKCPA